MKKYITKEGYEEITSLFSSLKKEKAHWVEEKRIAAEQGDRSENAEYIAAKENIRNIDKQLFRIQRILENNVAVDTSTRNRNDIVLFGSTVSLIQNGEKELTVKIVGSDELTYVQKIYPNLLCISNISPLGKNLMKKEVGDEIVVNQFSYEVIDIS